MKKYIVKIIIGCIFLIFLVYLFFFIFKLKDIVFSKPEDIIPFTNKFLQEMKEKADIPAIRSWLNSSPNKYNSGVWVDGSEWPKCIKELSPNDIQVFYDNNNRQIQLTWGGGFGHWGLIVGPENMEIPESDFEPHGEYRAFLEPGAYVFHEIQ